MAPAPQKKQPGCPYPQHVVEYQCAACEFAVDTAEALIAHLIEAHGRPESIRTRLKIQGELFLDGEGFYSNQWRITLGKSTVGRKLAAGPSGWDVALGIRRTKEKG